MCLLVVISIHGPLYEEKICVDEKCEGKYEKEDVSSFSEESRTYNGNIVTITYPRNSFRHGNMNKTSF